MFAAAEPAGVFRSAVAEAVKTELSGFQQFSASCNVQR